MLGISSVLFLCVKKKLNHNPEIFDPLSISSLEKQSHLSLLQITSASDPLDLAKIINLDTYLATEGKIFRKISCSCTG